MWSFKVVIITIILSLFVMSQLADAAPAAKKSRQHIKAKKSNNNNKLKANFKKGKLTKEINFN